MGIVPVLSQLVGLGPAVCPVAYGCAGAVGLASEHLALGSPCQLRGGVPAGPGGVQADPGRGQRGGSSILWGVG